MNLVTRRNLMKTAAAGLAMPTLRLGALAAESLKVGVVYLGPIGDWGWTWAHEKGRKAMVEALKGQVADYVENVKEDGSVTPFLRDLAQHDHCTGHRLVPNLGAYNSRFHQGRGSKAPSPASCRSRA